MVQKSINVALRSFFLCQKQLFVAEMEQLIPVITILTLLLLQHTLKCSEHLVVTQERPQQHDHNSGTELTAHKSISTFMSQQITVSLCGLQLPGCSHFLHSKLVAYMETVTSSLLLIQYRLQLLPPSSVFCIEPVWFGWKASRSRLIKLSYLSFFCYWPLLQM